MYIYVYRCFENRKLVPRRNLTQVVQLNWVRSFFLLGVTLFTNKVTRVKTFHSAVNI